MNFERINKIKKYNPTLTDDEINDIINIDEDDEIIYSYFNENENEKENINEKEFPTYKELINKCCEECKSLYKNNNNICLCYECQNIIIKILEKYDFSDCLNYLSNNIYPKLKNLGINIYHARNNNYSYIESEERIIYNNKIYFKIKIRKSYPFKNFINIEFATEINDNEHYVIVNPLVYYRTIYGIDINIYDCFDNYFNIYLIPNNKYKNIKFDSIYNSNYSYCSGYSRNCINYKSDIDKVCKLIGNYDVSIELHNFYYLTIDSVLNDKNDENYKHLDCYILLFKHLLKLYSLTLKNTLAKEIINTIINSSTSDYLNASDELEDIFYIFSIS